MGDLDGNGRFDVVDLLVLLHTLGGNFTAGTPPCALPDGGDWDGSGSLGHGDAAVEALRLAGRERAVLCEDPQPPVVTDLAVYPAPALPEPAPRATFQDPVFGFCTVQVTDRAADLDAGDTAGAQERVLPRPVLQRRREPDPGADHRRDLVPLQPPGRSGGVKRVELPGVDPRWDATDPGVLYSCEGTCLNRLNVRTGQVSLVHDFAADFAGQDVQTVWTRYENPSRDGRYWGLMAENGNWEAVALLVYDRQADAVTAVRSLPAGFDADNVSISPLGNYVVAYLEPDCPGEQTGTYASPCGFMVYNRALTQGSGPIPVAGHGDFALDAQGGRSSSTRTRAPTTWHAGPGHGGGDGPPPHRLQPHAPGVPRFRAGFRSPGVGGGLHLLEGVPHGVHLDGRRGLRHGAVRRRARGAAGAHPLAGGPGPGARLLGRA